MKKYFVFLLFGLFFCFACTKQDVRFSKKLSEIDSYATTGTREGTLKRLASLRGSAETSEQFLSIAKREYRFKDFPATEKTLLQGIKRSPSADLVAFLTYLALETEKYEIAAPYLGFLYGSEYETLASELSLKHSGSKISDSSFYMAAFRETGRQVFLVNAALLMVSNGQLEQALALEKERGDAISEFPYFWATLAFDLGHFSVVFDQLPFTLLACDLYSDGNDKLAAETKAHILLCADAYYGLGDVEMARAYWQMYMDRFSDNNPYPSYNLALTCETEAERAQALMACIENYPDFYPSVAKYVRNYEKYAASLKQNRTKPQTLSEIESFLQDKGFYSSSMEENFFETSFYTSDPETILNEKIFQYSGDPRYSLELLRWQLKQGLDIQLLKSKVETALEQYPESTEVAYFARWFYARLGLLDRAFAIDDSDKVEYDTFFAGLQASRLGHTEKALSSYGALFNTSPFQCAARVNYACTKALLREYDDAIQQYTEAIDFAKTDQEKSHIHTRIGEILVDLQQYSRAKSVLAYALQLDPENYSAKGLLTRIEATR